MKSLYFTFSILVLSLITLGVNAEVLTGKVIHISDGDTLTILTRANQQVKIKLAKIDAPEQKQVFGMQAKKALAALTFRKQVRVNVEIKYGGSSVGRVTVKGLDVSAELVRQGLAWVTAKNNDLSAVEVQAKQQKRGLWTSKHAVSPWVWRKGLRTVEHHPTVIRGMIIGNRSSRIYYRADCPGYKRVAASKKVLFKSEALAKANGYLKAGNCR